MTSTFLRSIRVHASAGVALALLGFVGAACQSQRHQVTQPAAGVHMGCRNCYDTVTQWRTMSPRQGDGMHAIRTHHCDGCKSDMTLFMENGVLKVKCPQCAPEGVACDQCQPPQGSSH